MPNTYLYLKIKWGIFDYTHTSRSSISPGGDHAVIGSKNGSVLVLKLNYGEIDLDKVYKKEHNCWVNACAWQPSGGSFSTVDAKGNLIIWQ